MHSPTCPCKLSRTPQVGPRPALPSPSLLPSHSLSPQLSLSLLSNNSLLPVEITLTLQVFFPLVLLKTASTLS